jgi:hypothetical protein
MTSYERKKLHSYVKLYNPNVILECGSGEGGSTYIFSDAIGENGKIYSCDPYRSPKFNSNKLIFRQIQSSSLIEYIKSEEIYPDFLFFDGPEDSEVALNDFKELENYVKVNTIFSMHDWCLTKRKFDNGHSIKSLKIKPYINSLSNWELIEELSGDNYNEGNESVGLCIYKKIA